MASSISPLPAGGAIAPLPAEVAARIKSSATITCLNQVVFGLVENAVDANATKVKVKVDFLRGGCSVEDNGDGVPTKEFSPDGGLAKMYHTSKLDAPGDAMYGGNGTFLSSLTSLALTEITSRWSQDERHTACALFHRSSQIRVAVPCEQSLFTFAQHGTKVVVRNLFGDMPVRVKQRAAISEDKAYHDRLWDETRDALVARVLAASRPLAIHLNDLDDAGRSVIIRHPLFADRQHQSNSSSSTRTYHTTVPSILRQAGLLSPEIQGSWIAASASSKTVSIKGVICEEPAPTKQLQFISLGIRPICAIEGRNEFYDHINKRFNLSDFGVIEEAVDHDEPETDRRQEDRRFKADGPTMKELRTRTKGVDRWPMFYLNIRLKDGSDASAYDRLDNNSGSTFRLIVDVLDALVSSWLTTNHFSIRGRVSKRKRDGLEESGRPQPQNESTPSRDQAAEQNADSQSRSDSRALPSRSNASRSSTKDGSPKTPFHEFSRIKCGTTPTSRKGHAEMTAQPPFTMVPLRVGELSRNNQQEVDSAISPETTSGETINAAREAILNIKHDSISEDETFWWEDPVSKEKYRVNSRTGQALLDLPRRLSNAANSTSPRDLLFQNPITLSRTKTDSGQHTNTPSRLDHLLESWQNPVFTPAEGGIRQVGLDSSAAEDLAANFISNNQIEKAFTEASNSHPSKLFKSALQKSTVISQVDKKFILVRMPIDDTGSSGSTLVLVDQHATDERVQVEHLFVELLTPNTAQPLSISALGLTSRVKYAMLHRPTVFEVTNAEADLFRKSGTHFADWGILYDLPAATPHSKLKVAVRTLPSVIAERCKLEPTALVSLLRAEVWRLHEFGTSTTHNTENDMASHSEYSWLSGIGRCPRGIVDMLNSRACRSAIMFNDDLTRKECEDLIRKVSRCAFPFQCAHGRPSMVPLINLGDSSGVWSEIESPQLEQKSFVQAYQEWRLD